MAFVASALVHLLALAVFLVQGVGEYQLPQPPESPEPPEPAVEAEIVRPEQVIPPENLPPIPEARVPPPTAPTQPRPQPTPEPSQPQATPAPAQQTPAPPAPIIARPVPTVQAPRAAPLVARQAPSVNLAPNAIPELVPAPAPTPAPAPAAPPAPAKPAAVQAPATTPGPVAPHLNIHKSEKEAPAGVPTLPMAPSPNQAPAGGRQAAAPGGGAPEAGGGGSRLQGLTPYPKGYLPNGGPGLRGSLVGCANAQAVGLSSVERAHCETRFGASIGSAPHLDDIPPDKRAAFDHAVDKADRARAYRNSTTARDMVGLGGVPKDETTTTIKLPN
ncbi:MAG TPA: hypothetical protein VGH03_06580 [Caulobacteraceae bacterium]